MKRKGFTIIEVLGVMVILSVLALIIYPVISENIIRGKENALTVNIGVIEKATENWLDTNAGIVPKENFTLYLIDLKASGLIDKEIKNPKTGKKFPDDMEIQVIYDAENEKYVPNVEITTGTKVGEDIDSSRVVLLLKSTKVEYIEVNSEYTLKYRDEDIIAKYADGTAVNKNDIKITNHRYLNGSINEPEGFVSEVPSSGVELNTSKFYTYEVTYEVTNRNGITSRAVRKIIVRDTTPPTINVPANAKISKTQDSFNVDDEITYSDNSCKKGVCSVGSMKQLQAGSVDIGIVKYGNVVTGHVGEYTITYVAQDQSGNTTKKTRTISVVNEECPTIKIKGTTESGKETYNKSVTLTAQVSKVAVHTNDNDKEVASEMQWYKKINGAWQAISGATEGSYEVTDYFAGSYKVMTNTDNLICSSSEPGYETFIHLPKFECSILDIPDHWVTSATLKTKLQLIDEGGIYQVASDDANSSNWKDLTETFTVNQHKTYTIKAKNSYTGKTPKEIDSQADEGTELASEIQAELNTQSATCTIGPAATNWNSSTKTYHQQLLIDDDDPNITIKLYNQSTGALLGTYKNKDEIKTSFVNYRYKVVIEVDDKRNKAGEENGKELSGVKEFKVNGVLQSSNTYTLPIAPEGTSEYTIYVKDGVGRTRTQKLKIKSDTTPPRCGTTTGESTTWTNADRTVSVGCVENQSDLESGCAQGSYSTTYSTTTKTSSIQIADIVGNKQSCGVNVYVDKTRPSCSLTTSGTAGNNGWYKSNVTVKVTGSDAHSEVKSAVINGTSSATTTVGQTSGTTVTATVTDNATNTTSCSVTVKSDQQAPGCSVAKTAVNLESGINVRISCSDNLSGVSSCDGAGATSVDRYGLTYSRSYTVVDAAGHSNSCPVTVSAKTQYATQECSQYNRNEKKCGCKEYKTCTNAKVCGTKTETYTYQGTCTTSAGGVTAQWCRQKGGSWKQKQATQSHSGTCTYSYSCTKTGTRTVAKTCTKAGCGCKKAKRCLAAGCESFGGYSGWSDTQQGCASGICNVATRVLYY